MVTKLKIVFASVIILFVSSFGFGQTNPCWQASIHKKVLAKGSLADKIGLNLSKFAKGKLDLQYQCGTEADWNRYFILMDNQRKNIAKTKMKDKTNMAAFDIAAIRQKAKGQSLILYTISIPKDSLLAMSVRVATVEIGKVQF